MTWLPCGEEFITTC